MSDFRADLHCHTTCSDGSSTPEELVRFAKEIGLSAISITDHDTIEAYSIAEPLCKQMDIALLSGVEFSSTLKSTSVHILGYGFQLDNKELQEFCRRHSERRLHRNRAILALLAKHHMPINEEELISDGKGHHSVGRPHIALAMLKKGYVTSLQEAFKKYIGEDRPCYAPGTVFSVQETIDIIHQAKGLAVIAHPQLISNSDTLQNLLQMNFDGIECYYGKFLHNDCKRWLKIAKKKNWLVTGGSDFHGTIKPMLNLGCSWIDEPTFQAMLNRLKQT